MVILLRSYQKLLQGFWGLMGLFFLNISIDAIDPSPNHVPEDLSFNEQESLVEFVVETLLGFGDAIAEYDDQDGDEKSAKKSDKLDLGVEFLARDNRAWGTVALRTEHAPHAAFMLHPGYAACVTPPPES